MDHGGNAHIHMYIYIYVIICTHMYMYMCTHMPLCECCVLCLGSALGPTPPTHKTSDKSKS